jgi:hypothetical protein
VYPDLSDLNVDVPEDTAILRAWDVVPIPPVPTPEQTPTTLEDLERAFINSHADKAVAQAAIVTAKGERGRPV